MTAPRIIKRGAVRAVHEANAMTGEVPCWDAANGTLWWIDVQGQRLLGFSPKTGRQAVHNLPSMPGLLALRRAGGLLVGLEDGLYAFDPGKGLGERLIAVEADDQRTRINDGAADDAGRLWFGTMDKAGSGQPIGSLYCLSPGLMLRLARPRIAVPNATAFSPDGLTFYFADTPTQRVDAHSYDAQRGEVGPPRSFVQYSSAEKPDGACVDAEGALWIAVIEGGRLERRLADGTLHSVVELPVSRPTMPMFGGDGRTLFITSQRRFLSAERLVKEPLAGDLLAVEVEVPAGPQRMVAF